ncbi:MAG: hypothetical protein HDT20_04390 [Oscillibacter sp.]|nr:hypothetical protein [Oscillibacter sp.]
MSNITRTALKGGGKIHITMDARPNGDFELWVTESWARLTAVERCTISAQQLETAEDPDGLIREEVIRLVRKAHINWEASKMVKELQCTPY